MKLHDNAGAISALNDLMELCASNEYGRILHYLFSKARCYRAMKSYQSAVSELLDWLDIVKRNKMKERQPQRDSTIYIELAELYFELDDYDNAEKYANLSTAAERKQVFLVPILFGTFLELVGQNDKSVIFLSEVCNKGIISLIRTF